MHTLVSRALYERRLKQSRIHELNDPFELTPYNLTDPDLRRAFYKTRNDMGQNKGMVCFSADWRDPVIWAHYSDKHRGAVPRLRDSRDARGPRRRKQLRQLYTKPPAVSSQFFGSSGAGAVRNCAKNSFHEVQALGVRARNTNLGPLKSSN